MWNRLRYFKCSLFRRFLFLLGSLAVILLAVCLPLTASAETINIKSGYGSRSSNALITRYSDGYPVDRLEQQYTYGGNYNPLILVDTQPAGYSWTDFDASVYISFNRSVPAGTALRISCGGWFSHSYTFSSTYKPHMYASPYSIADVSNGSYENYLGSRVLLGTGSGDPVRSSNGQYFGYLFSGTFTTRFPMSGIYLCFSGALSSGRTGGAYFGISCDSITISVDHVSPAESDVYGTPESGAFDDTSTAIGDAETAESALMSGGESAISGAFDSLTSSVNSLNSFISGFVFVQHLFRSLVRELPFLDILIPISVGLGLFAMIIGVVGGFVSRSKGGGKDDSSG